MKTYTLYKITFPNNTCYIGQTSNHVYIRWGDHLSRAQAGIHINTRIQEVYDKFGYDEWKFEVIQTEVSDDLSYISLLEQHYIKQTPNTLNRKHLTEEEKRKQLCKASKRYYWKIYNLPSVYTPTTQT